jgi:hypothetical protein
MMLILVWIMQVGNRLFTFGGAVSLSPIAAHDQVLPVVAP